MMVSRGKKIYEMGVCEACKYADGHWKNSAGVRVGPRAKCNIWGPTSAD